MKRAHLDAINIKLDQLWFEGWVKFDRWELLSFFDRSRVTIAIWNEINEMWIERFDEDSDPDPLAFVTVRSEESVTTPHSFLLINRGQVTEI